VIGILAAAVLGSFAMAQEHGPAAVKQEPCCELRTAMRKLWEEHIAYTRNFIISALAVLPDTDSVAQRLLRNQDDIGAAIKPYYGEQAGKRLSSLLRDHILIAAEVVKAAKADKQDELTAQLKKWTGNGREIAAFLSGANPNWSRRSLEEMLQTHLDLTTAEVVGRLKQDWTADIKAYDEGHEHMLMFADMLAAGIKRQFPAKFKS
jgi:phage terminase Nu1 subunit (DNA packaging protein)